MTDSRQRIVHFFNLDVLRAIAVAMVFVYHGHLAYNGWFFRPDDSPEPVYQKYLTNFFENLNIGVDFFFVISGFLITYLLLVEKENTQRVSIGKFYMRRILRIWPLYFLIVIFAHALCKATEMPDPHYWGTVFFVNNFETIRLGHMDYPFVHFWSLSVEEQYYLLWPIVIALIPRNKVIYAIGGLLLLSIGYRITVATVMENPELQLIYHSLSRGDGIMIGALLAWFHFRKPFEMKIHPAIRIGVLCLLVFSFFVFIGIGFHSWYEPVWAHYIFTGGFAFLMLNYLFNPKAFAAFKKKNFLHYIGKISFGIYVFHNVLLLLIVKQMISSGCDNAIVFWLVYTGIVLLVSVLSYELFEKRILRLKDRFSVILSRR